MQGAASGLRDFLLEICVGEVKQVQLCQPVILWSNSCLCKINMLAIQQFNGKGLVPFGEAGQLPKG